MRDDEMISTGYPFKCATRYDNEEYICYQSENDTIQDVVSMFMESILGNKFKPSKDYGVSIVHREKHQLMRFFQFFRRRMPIMYCYFSIKKKSISKLLFKSKELPQKNSKTITIDDVEDENSKSNECISSVDGKSTSKLSNNLKKLTFNSHIDFK